MDNFGYREPHNSPKPAKKIRAKRSTSSNPEADVSAEEYLLNHATYRRFSNFNTNLKKKSLRLKIDKDIALSDYVFTGHSAAVESPFNFSYEESSRELNTEIKHEAVERILIKFVENLHLLKLVEDVKTNPFFKNYTKPEKDVALLLAAFYDRPDLVQHLIEDGADVEFHDSEGMSALHLSSFVGCLKSVQLLINNGSDVNAIYKHFAPLHCAVFGNNLKIAELLVDNGADPWLITKKTNCEESVLHCAVRTNSVECLTYFLSFEDAEADSIQPSGANPVHLAAEFGVVKCLEVLLEVDGLDINKKTRIRDKKSTALHLASEEGHPDCLALLLIKGADALLKNHRGFSALHLAARSSNLECLEVLMRTGNSNPNAEDFDKRTPLHAAVRKSEKTFIIMKKLICWGAEVNKKDEYGCTPLHLAAMDGLKDCVDMLIEHGANVTIKSNNHSTALSIMKKRTPSSMDAIKRKLNDSINLLNFEESNDRNVEIRFDFRYIIQNEHAHESILLETFVKEGHKQILEHPVCAAFLHIKWMKVRKYYLARFLFCLTFTLFLTLYVMTAVAYNCIDDTDDDNVEEQELCQDQSLLGKYLRENLFSIKMQWWCLVGVTIFELFRKLYGLVAYTSFFQYVKQFQNWMDWYVIVSVFFISCVYTGKTYMWQNHIGSFAVLAAWTNLMLMVGQFPSFGLYFAMYRKVQREFGKVFTAYSSILVGFTFSFCVIFPESSMFANPFVGFINLLMMMIGEHDLELLVNEPDGTDPPVLLEISAQIIYILFLTSVTIVLMNLLVGIAVPDVRRLRKTAGLSKLVSQTMLISYVELVLNNAFMPKCLKEVLCSSIMISNELPRMALDLEPLNVEEKRLPSDIIRSAYNLAMTSVYKDFINPMERIFETQLPQKENRRNKKKLKAMDAQLDHDILVLKNLRREVNQIKYLIQIQRTMLEKIC